MATDLKLRPAKLSDSKTILSWRNDPDTVRACKSGRKVNDHEHNAWMRNRIKSDYFYIAERNGFPVGTVRADFIDGAWVLSWNVNSQCRGMGIGAKIVGMIFTQLTGKIRVEVLSWNIPSVKIADGLGMKLIKTDGGLNIYEVKKENGGEDRA